MGEKGIDSFIDSTFHETEGCVYWGMPGDICLLSRRLVFSSVSATYSSYRDPSLP